MRLELEKELEWRREEMVFFNNQLTEVADDKKDRYRKSLVLMLYSHFEGYMKISLQTYIKYLNLLNLKRSEADIHLQASSMSRKFDEHEDTNRKPEPTNSISKEDKHLHRLGRRVELLEKLDGYKERILIIDDKIINTESNLRSEILQKNLYRIGLPTDLFESHHKSIDALVNRRNEIAHGKSTSGVGEREYKKWSTEVNRIMNETTRALYDCVIGQKYLKNSTGISYDVITV